MRYRPMVTVTAALGLCGAMAPAAAADPIPDAVVGQPFNHGLTVSLAARTIPTDPLRGLFIAQIARSRIVEGAAP